MTLTDFQSVLCNRIPSAEEFVAFAHAQGWSFRFRNDKLQMLVPSSNAMAVSFAKMLSREPWRTRVRELLGQKADIAAVAQTVKEEAVYKPIGREPKPKVAEKAQDSEDIRYKIINTIIKRAIETGRAVFGSGRQIPCEPLPPVKTRRHHQVPHHWTLICCAGDPEWTALPLVPVQDA